MPVQTKKKDFTILYGSQTGQAEAISEELFDRSFKEGFNPVRFCLSQFEKRFSIEKESCVVIICSTTGEGEPPDTATKFVRRIKKKTLSSRHLQNLSFAVLGLGDSNYTNFCNCAKTIVSRLLELGAEVFYDTGYGDDAVGLEEVVEPWIDGLFPALHNLLKNENTFDIGQSLSTTFSNSEANSIMPIPGKEYIDKNIHSVKPTLKSSVPPLSNSELKIPSSPASFLRINFINNDDHHMLECDWEYPSAATSVKDAFIKSARQLTFDSSVKKCLEVELDTGGIAFDYEPGDSFGIVCGNKSDEVDYLVRRLGIEDIADKLLTLEIMEDTLKKSPSVPQHIHCPSTLRVILTQYVDFRAVPRKACLRMLVDYTENEAEKRRLQELCSTQGTKDYGIFIREGCIGLIQILQIFPSCMPPVERILELLPQLLPREYSIASYSSSELQYLKFVFNIIELPDFQSNKRLGLCTGWLDSITSSLRSVCNTDIEDEIKNLSLNDSKIKLYFRRPTPFRFPDDPSRPLIMIGPGTGVAPYIGFLQKREFLKENQPSIVLGTALLFFGCRYRDKDFIYKDELLSFKERGILTELYTSFSRDQMDSECYTKYVQDNIKLQKELVLDLLFLKDGAVFICGDAKHMGRDVTNTFVELIEENKNVSKIDAIKILNELREKKQFLEDVWT